MDSQLVSLYVHIPFCTHICPFCDFTKLKAIKTHYQPYIDACCREIKMYAKSTQLQIDTIYVGGGTPSVLPVELYQQLFKSISDCFDVSNIREISMEFNPEDVALSYVEDILNLGVNRFSLGVQTFRSEEVQFLDRQHTVEQSLRSIELFQSLDVNLSVDVMFGLPQQNTKFITESLSYITDYSPQHVSCYGLTIEPNTPFYQRKVNVATDEDYYDYYSTIIETLCKAGYEHYEVSSFALPTYKCLHNSRYWAFKDYIGIGLGAHSLFNGRRYHNKTVLSDYIADSCPAYFLIDSKPMSEKELILEHIIANLRVAEGICFLDYKQRYNIDFLTVFSSAIEQGVQLNLMDCSPDRLRLTKKGLYLLNEVCLLFV